MKLIPWKKNLKKYYTKSDIFVLTSLYEGLGNVLLMLLIIVFHVFIQNVKSGNEILLNQMGDIQLKLKIVSIRKNVNVVQIINSLNKTYKSTKLYRFLQTIILKNI